MEYSINSIYGYHVNSPVFEVGNEFMGNENILFDASSNFDGQRYVQKRTCRADNFLKMV